MIQKDRAYQLGHERIGKLLLMYSTPAMIAMMVHALYNLVDTIFIGQGVGKDALAGLAITFPVTMCLLAIGQIVGMGAASIISRALGAEEQRRANQAAGTSITLVLIFTGLFTVFGLYYLTPMLRMFGATDQAMPYARDYVSVIVAGGIFFAYGVTLSSLIRAEGNMKLAMYAMFLGAAINLILDPVFIFGLHMGIRGAAIATIIANMVVFFYMIRYLMSNKCLFDLHLADLVPEWDLIPEMLRLGMSNFVRVGAQIVLMAVMNNSVAHYGANIHLAILGVSNRLIMFFQMPLFGFAQGFQPIVGFNFGAQHLHRVKESLNKAIIGATIIMGIGFLALMFFTAPLIRCFNSDTELIAEGTPIIRIMVILLPAIGFQVVGATFFQALGKWFPAMVLSMSRQLIFLIPLMLIMPLYMGLPGVWYAIPLSDGLAVLLTGVWLWLEMRRLIPAEATVREAS